MNSSRRKNIRTADRGGLDKKVDQFIEVGRQFVDGVSGTRPGSRKRISFQQISRKNVKNMGNWVTEKMDSFFEDDYDDWNQDIDEQNNKQFKSFNRNAKELEKVNSSLKRPLQSISLRIKNNNNEQRRLLSAPKSSDQEWEEDSYFQINRWQRSSINQKQLHEEAKSERNRNVKNRNFPRSSRRRI